MRERSSYLVHQQQSDQLQAQLVTRNLGEARQQPQQRYSGESDLLRQQHLHVPDWDTRQHPLAGHDRLQDVARNALDEVNIVGHRGDCLTR